MQDADMDQRPFPRKCGLPRCSVRPLPLAPLPDDPHLTIALLKQPHDRSCILAHIAPLLETFERVSGAAKLRVERRNDVQDTHGFYFERLSALRREPRHHRGKGLPKPVDVLLETPALNAFECAFPHRIRAATRVQYPPKRSLERAHIAYRKNAPVHAVLDQVRRTAHIVRDDYGPGCVYHLVHDKSPGLVP